MTWRSTSSKRSRENSGRRPRAPAAGRVSPITRSVRSPRVRRAFGGTGDVGLPVATGGAGCPGAGRDASVGGPVPVLRISADSDLPSTGRPCDEPRSGPSTLASRGAAGARRRPRRRVASGRPGPLPPTARNHVWAYDFVFDTCANWSTLKCLTIVDEWTRECMAIDVAGGVRSGRVIEVLAQLVSVHGAPRHLRSDNGVRGHRHLALAR